VYSAVIRRYPKGVYLIQAGFPTEPTPCPCERPGCYREGYRCHAYQAQRAKAHANDKAGNASDAFAEALKEAAEGGYGPKAIRKASGPIERVGVIRGVSATEWYGDLGQG
jgi:hypothetical protein